MADLRSKSEGKYVSVVGLDKSHSTTKSVVNFSKKSLSRLKVRRASYGFSGVPGIRPVERTSQLAIEFKRPPMVYLPTYQLDPNVPFHIPSVRDAINESLDEHFTGHKYTAGESPGLTLRLAGEIMRKVKNMPFNRYRIISIVTLAQKRAQSYNNAVTFLWDHERDSYVDITRETTSAFIQVTVFGIYLD
ncbi:dynein light chain Tctex-type protein 2B-like [Plodia interpunctella]|uniref:dynein light chain Tctex-type protein 2B-like n=1 Tax=Plodia interpunctella TaxID=58824 RepID=UPI0023681671|nr:dynein light chain Tctex-type protein 2B-like [Plodia interpunctella]